MTSVGEALIAGLAARGVDTIFGIPGVHTLELYRGLTTSGVRHVTPRHEQGAGFMADGWSRVAGRPGVCLVISGPGVTNVLTPIAQARQDARPLLVLSASVSRDERGRGRGVIHDLPDQAALTSAVTRLTLSIDEPGQLEPRSTRPGTCSRGARGRRGPCTCRCRSTSAARGRDAARPATGHARPALPQADALARAVDLLARAERPALILGGGARDAGPAALALARRLGAPIGLTINGKGAIPSTDPLCVPSRMMVAPFDRLFLEADVLLAVGTQLSDLDWWALDGPFAPAGRIIRVDLDAEVLDANAPAEIGLVGDAAPVLDALAAALPDDLLGPRSPPSRPGASRVARPRPLAGGGRRVPAARTCARRRAAPRPHRRGRLDAARLCREPRARRRDPRLVADADRLRLPRHRAADGDRRVRRGPRPARARDRRRRRRPLHPPRAGRGARPRLSLPLIVWNNGGYGEIRDAMLGANVPVLGTDASAVDLPRVAEGFGCIGARAESLDHVQELVAAALDAPVPTLIEVTPGTRGVSVDG